MDPLPVISPPYHISYYNIATPPINRLSPAIGTAQSLPAQSCNQVKQHLIDNCNKPPISGAYWINGIQVYVTVSYLLPPLLTTNRYTAI